jgi:hypothetical protein
MCARLRDREDVADLGEGQILVVAQLDDDSLALGQLRDGLHDPLTRFLRARALRRVHGKVAIGP